ncbi:MAG TPA: hypothetical protein VEM13_05960 [Gemmatimonadales bacterium]|nr:hypothetical protein [Gemmatimonadales bacterium]
MRPGRIAFLGAVLAAAACVEQLTAPGTCPDYCPTGQITVKDTVLGDVIGRDSAYRGYVIASDAAVMLVAHVPLPTAGDTLDSRAIFRFNRLGPRVLITGDTAAIQSVDSARMQLYIIKRDTAAHDLTLALYRLPITIDSTTTFGDLTTPFADSPLRTVNVDSLHAQPGRKDTTSGDSTFKNPVTGDSLVIDTTNHRLIVSLKLDSSQARYVAADTGKVAYGVGLSASPDSLASIALGKADVGPVLRWYLVVDSAGTSTPWTPPQLTTALASFVFKPPPAPLDSTLAVGGVPSARSILRVTLPRSIRDSSQILRGTLVLVPAVAPRGAPADSFVIEAHTVVADFGAKSPILVDATRTDTVVARIGATDTLRIEVTNLLQYWQGDSTRPASIVLRAKKEGAELGEIRFFPSAATSYRPALHITYSPRFPFGKP